MAEEQIDVYLEEGAKRVFAGAPDWPGWCRSGSDEASALAALVEYGRRYHGVVARAGIDFERPTDVSQLSVVERLEGNATTDFGAPDASPSIDEEAIDDDDLARLVGIIDAAWEALDRALEAAEGKELRKGPRGGGRDQAKMTDHVADAERAYLARIGFKAEDLTDASSRLAALRDASREGFARAARHGVEPGPRGGKRWTPRYYVRRSVWHVLDHAWEIEDRIEPD